jgi:DNA-binding LacI/PurR family transcriptional regulator
MKPTIYDVAKKAGVSIATVSNVVNGTGKIGDKTKLKVLEIMKEINYRPSVVASALMGKSTYTIGLLIPDISNPFFAEIARSVEDRGHELGFNLVICSTDNNPKKEAQYLSLLKQKSVDGIILGTGLRNDITLKELQEENVPIAVIARETTSITANSVLVDDYSGGYQATSHLIELGHERIAVIAEDLNVMSSRERVRGYKQALEEKGLNVDEKYILVSDFTVEDGKKITHQLLDSDNPPTAVFACNDMLAIGVIQAARDKGYNIPEKLSVVGFDNTILATVTDPPLTTVAQPILEMGHQVVDLLIQEIKEKKKVKKRIMLSPDLIVRKTTSVPSK